MVQWVFGSILHRSISHSSQCSMTGVTKAVVYSILSLGLVGIRPLAANQNE